MENTVNYVNTWTCNCGAVFFAYEAWLVHHNKMLAIDPNDSKHNEYRDTETSCVPIVLKSQENDNELDSSKL